MNVRVLFRGLLHYIANQDRADAVKVCVVLPDAPGHDARIRTFEPTLLRRNGQVVREPIDFRGKRVALRFTPTPVAVAGTGFEDAVLGQRIVGAVALNRFIGNLHVDRNLSFVGVRPPARVAAQVLVGEGSFATFPSSVPPLVDLPDDLTGRGQGRITMSEKVRMDASNVTRAEIVVYPLSESTVPEAIYTIESTADPALIQVEYLCTPTGLISFRDNDFRFQYQLLSSLPGGRPLDGMPVPMIARFSDAASERGGNDRFMTPRDFKPRGCNCASAAGLSRRMELDQFLVPTT